MNKQGGFAMSGLAILGICLVAIGLLTIGYGGVTVGFSLSVDFQSFFSWRSHRCPNRSSFDSGLAGSC